MDSTSDRDRDFPSSRSREQHLPAAKRAQGSSCLAIATVFGSCLIGAAALLLMPTGLIGLVFLSGLLLLAAVIGVHYLVWGKWLSGILMEEARREADADQRRE